MSVEKNEVDLIAVIVPIYNVEQYIEECVHSILNQTYGKLEVILVDDGSTDNSFAICRQLSKEDARIKVLHKDNGGPLSVKKIGLESTEADYIMFVDADDWIKPEMCESLYNKMREENVDLVTSGIIRYFSKDRCIYSFDNIGEGKYSGEDYKKKIIPYMLCDGAFRRRGIDASLAIKMFRREMLYPVVKCADEDYGYLFAEDTAVLYPYMLRISSVYIMKECFYFHRQYLGHNEMYYEDKNFFQEMNKLYTYMSTIFEETEYRVSLMKQLRCFIYGLWVTKADIQAEKIVNNLHKIQQQYLFPFSRVKSGSRVLLYGAGEVGQAFYRQLLKTQYCKEIIWQDKQYVKYSDEGLPVKCVNMNLDVDVCVVAVQNSELAYEIKQQLIEQGMEKSKIIWENPVLYMW